MMVMEVTRAIMMDNQPEDTMTAALATKTLQYSKAGARMQLVRPKSISISRWPQWCQWTQSPSSAEHVVLMVLLDECQPLVQHLGLTGSHKQTKRGLASA